MKKRLSGAPALIFKLLVTVGLLAGILHAVKVDAVVKNLQGVAFISCAAAFGLQLTQIIILGYRWYRILCASDIAVRLGWAARVVFIGSFFNQSLPTSLGGDAVRVVMLRPTTRSLETAVNAVLVDRLSGLAGLIPFLLLGAPWLWAWTGDVVFRLASFMLTLLMCAGLALYFLADRLLNYAGPLAKLRPISAIARGSSYARAIAWRSNGAAGTAALAVGTHFMTVVIVIVLAAGLGSPLPLGTAIVLVPPIIAAAMLPISFGGWGTREAAMIASLGIAGVPPASALAISLVLGLILILATLPGAIFWLTGSPSQRL